MTGGCTGVRETGARQEKDQGQFKARAGKESAGYLREKTIGKDIEKKKKPREIREIVLKSTRLIVKLYKLCAEFIWWALKFIGWEQSRVIGFKGLGEALDIFINSIA